LRRAVVCSAKPPHLTLFPGLASGLLNTFTIMHNGLIFVIIGTPKTLEKHPAADVTAMMSPGCSSRVLEA
jgi:hypothetical protein